MKSSLVSPDEVYGWGQKDAGNLPVATVSLWPDPDDQVLKITASPASELSW